MLLFYSKNNMIYDTIFSVSQPMHIARSQQETTYMKWSRVQPPIPTQQCRVVGGESE